MGSRFHDFAWTVCAAGGGSSECDDYDHKRADYEAMGIPEYWIVEHYLGLGGRRYVGVPKQPTVTICQWIDGEYQMQQFHRGDLLISSTLPQLQLDTSQIFDAGT